MMQTRAASVPNVPGAKGTYPIGPSVAIYFNIPCITARIVTLISLQFLCGRFRRRVMEQERFYADSLPIEKA